VAYLKAKFNVLQYYCQYSVLAQAV